MPSLPLSSGLRAALRARGWELVAGLLFGLAAFLWLGQVNPDPPSTPDATRDLLYMRDCLELGKCHTIGAKTSFQGVSQGAIWIHLLTMVHLLGGSTLTVRWLVLALMAAAVATVFVVARRLAGWRVAAPAAFLVLALARYGDAPSLLVNPSTVLFPEVICISTLLLFELTGRQRFLVLSAFAASVAADTHVAALSLVPSLLAVACLSEKPLRSALTASTVFLGTSLLTSRAALASNVRDLIARERWLPMWIGLVAFFALAWVVRRRYRTWRPMARLWSLGFLLVTPFGVTAVWLALKQHHTITGTYFHAILAPASVMFSAATVIALARITRVLGKVAQGVATLVPLTVSLGVLGFMHGAALQPDTAIDPGGWTLEDARLIAERLKTKGWTFDQTLYRTQSVRCAALVQGLSPYLPVPNQQPVEPHRHMQVRRLSMEEATRSSAPDVEVVPLGGGLAATLKEVHSWVDFSRMSVCVTPAGRQDRSCSQATPSISEKSGPGQFLFVDRSYPELHGHLADLPYVERQELQLLPASSEVREIALLDETQPDQCAWRVTHVEGVQVESPLPARKVRLRAPASPTRSVIVIEKPFGMPGCEATTDEEHYPVCIFEEPSPAPATAGVKP